MRTKIPEDSGLLPRRPCICLNLARRVHSSCAFRVAKCWSMGRRNSGCYSALPFNMANYVKLSGKEHIGCDCFKDWDRNAESKNWGILSWFAAWCDWSLVEILDVFLCFLGLCKTIKAKQKVGEPRFCPLSGCNSWCQLDDASNSMAFGSSQFGSSWIIAG